MAQWYYARDKQKLGPFSTEQMQQLAGAGLVQPGDMVLEDGTQKWMEARSVAVIYSGPPPETPSLGGAPSTMAPAAGEAESSASKILVTCPHCRHRMSLNETVRGREISCPQCKQKYVANPQQRKRRAGNLVAYQVQQGDGEISIAVSCSCGEVTRASFKSDQTDKTVTCSSCGRTHRGFEED